MKINSFNNIFRRRRTELCQSMEESTHTESQNLILNLIGEKLIIHCSVPIYKQTKVKYP